MPCGPDTHAKAGSWLRGGVWIRVQDPGYSDHA